ncbi:MAG: hypothetical protein ACR652_24685 [Methylocystis sp.]|uniref:hypothetical protein n=1 Tax=Methylocystis sp. TaxID=1911079 RepID=UPI003DA4D087
MPMQTRRPRAPTDPNAPQGDPAQAPQQPPQIHQAPTFSQLQSQGYARPAPQQQPRPDANYLAQARAQEAAHPGSVSKDFLPGGSMAGPQIGQAPQGGAMMSMHKDPTLDGDVPTFDQPTDDSQVTSHTTTGTGNPPTNTGTKPTDPTKPTPFNPQGQQFAQTLQSMFGNWKPQGQFEGQSQQTQAPTFTPGANPFTPQGFQGSYQAQQAPGAQFTPQFQGPNNPLANQTTGAVQSFLQNPNGFNSDAVKQSYGYLSGQIDQDFNQGQLALRDEMAKRGLSESSINGERSNILLGNRRSAQEDLASRLLTQQAESQTGAQQAAIQAALGYGNQNFNQGLGAYQANAGTNNQNFQQALATAAFQGDQNAMAIMQNMGIQGFNNAAGQQGYQNQQTQQNQNFQNQMQSAGFNAGQNQQGFQNALAGYGANLQGQQQGFNQQQQLLSQLLGYEQQGFQNQLGTAQLNAQQQQWYQQYLAQLAQAGK